MKTAFGPNGLAICEDCNQEMTQGTGCSAAFIMIGDKVYKRIPLNDPREFVPGVHEIEVCHDCNVTDGQFHHFGCDMERCPVCNGQLISCGCKVKFVLEVKH